MVPEEPPELTVVEFGKTLLASVEMEVILLGLLLFAIVSALGIALVSLVLIRLPATYFSSSRPESFWSDAHPVVRWTGLIIKNVVGFAILLVGIVLMVPGIPGPGLLIVLLGIMLMDFPGKRRLERWLIGRPKIFAAVNRLRQQFRRAPFVVGD